MNEEGTGGGGGCRGASNCRMGLHGSDTIEIFLPQYSTEIRWNY